MTPKEDKQFRKSLIDLLDKLPEVHPEDLIGKFAHLVGLMLADYFEDDPISDDEIVKVILLDVKDGVRDGRNKLRKLN